MSKRWLCASGMAAAVWASSGCGVTATNTGTNPLLDETPRSTPNGLVLVSADNYVRAESDAEFAQVVNENGFGRFFHLRDITPVDNQLVVRPNRDTLYSAAVFDLQSSPATITLPDCGERFMSAQVISEDEYVTDVFYGQGVHTLNQKSVGTRYVLVAVRTLVNPNDPADLAAARSLQDAIEVHQENAGTFDIPRWDPATMTKVRAALLSLAETVPDSRGMFGAPADTDPVRHLIGAAAAWGGNPEKDALYLNVTPTSNDGKTLYALTVKDVPVKDFWSVTVYNKEGYFSPNPQQAYSVNSVTAQKSEDGSVTVRFGDCKTETPNCLPITPGWNYLVRLYRPAPQVLSGKWTFPEAQPVG